MSKLPLLRFDSRTTEWIPLNIDQPGLEKDRKFPSQLSDIFVRNLDPDEREGLSGFLGEEPIVTAPEIEDEEGKDGKLWASDHLGIWMVMKASGLLGVSCASEIF
jgi:hypothetical protein